MKEKLIIRNFGPIKNVELDLGRFNVLIGEQATGKSTVAKVLAVCRYFSYIFDLFENGFHAGDNFVSGLDAKGLGSFNFDSFIYYKCYHYSITVQHVKVPRRFHNPETDQEVEYEEREVYLDLKNPSNEFTILVKELRKLQPSIMEQGYGIEFSNWTIPTSFFQNDVAKVLDNPFYVPTERGLQSVFSLGKNSIQNVSDSLYNQFAEIDFIARRFTKETEIEPLNIFYKNVDGRGYIRKKEEETFYSLFNGASGYQSTIPVVLLIKYYTESKKKKKTFIIEEPELNLFPNAQQKLVEYLAEKMMSDGHSMFINTHSPYVLTSLNNLMYAFKVGQEHAEETSRIINKDKWLNPDEVSAYIMLPNGTCEDIVDREESLIKAEKIDQVSSLINKDFSELINIEMGVTA